jgi:hypothetical protein
MAMVAPVVPAIIVFSLIVLSFYYFTVHGNGNGVASTEESSPTSQGGPNDEKLETQESILSELRKTQEDVSKNLRENTEAIWYLREENWSIWQ